MALLLAGCGSPSVGGSSGGGSDNPPVTENSYTITWKNWDGSVLETDTNVKEGTTPTYDGVTPTRPGDSDQLGSRGGF